MTPAPIPVHLRQAAEKELKRYLDAGVLEECNHATE